MNKWRYSVNCMLARDLSLEKLGIETLPRPIHTLGPCKYTLAPLLWKSTEIWPSYVFSFQPFIPPLLLQPLHMQRKVKSTAAEPSSHGSRSSQGTNSSETPTGWSRDICSTLSLSSCQPWPWSWHAKNWHWSEIQGNTQPELRLQEHSLGPDAFHSELRGKPPTVFQWNRTWFPVPDSQSALPPCLW